MHLHEDTAAFTELIGVASEAMGLPRFYIEKDYWVTKALKHLAESEHRETVVFKGGTSLSKAHKIIHRFSEDIDLAIFVDGLGDNRKKRLLRETEKATAQGLSPIENDQRISKGSNFRKTVYQFPRPFDEDVVGQVSPELLIEVNCFTQPEPFESMTLQTMIADILVQYKRQELILQHSLQSFEVNVLTVRRTLVEKVLAVTKDSYHEKPVDKLSERIRHLYDICLIIRQEEIRNFIDSDEFNSLCKKCIDDEKRGLFDAAGYLQKPLSQAPLFEQLEDWAVLLEPTYRGNFSQLVYGELPDFTEIKQALEFLHARLLTNTEDPGI